MTLQQQAAMSSEFFVHATGLAALVINVLALLGRCDVALRRQSILAGFLWAVNNVLLGAHSAAALSVVSATRTATSAATLDRGRIARRNTCLLFGAMTIAASAATWTGWIGTITLVAALMSTYAMFYMRGVTLRLTMLVVSMMWMVNAWQYGSWEQMAGNVLTACAAGYGAWTLSRRAAPVDALP